MVLKKEFLSGSSAKSKTYIQTASSEPMLVISQEN